MLPLFGLLILALVFYIDYQQKKQIKQSKKYDYLFTTRKKSEILRLRYKGRYK